MYCSKVFLIRIDNFLTLFGVNHSFSIKSYKLFKSFIYEIQSFVVNQIGMMIKMKVLKQ